MPSKWRFVDLETGDVWRWGPKPGTSGAFIRDKEFGKLRQKLKAVNEIATLLGVTPSRVTQLSQRVDFPAPAYNGVAGRLWWATDVKHWLQGWPRLPGRPRKTKEKPGPTGPGNKGRKASKVKRRAGV